MLKTKYAVVILAAWIIVSSGCTTTKTVVAPYPPLPLPERPVLPAISQDEFKTVEDDTGEIKNFLISPDTAIKIFKRDKMRKQYELKLEAVIKATH